MSCTKSRRVLKFLLCLVASAVATSLPIHSSALASESDPLDPHLAECSNGVAVHKPNSNPDLVMDCVILLSIEDTLFINGDLDWSADIPMTEWEGVRGPAYPGRVTELDLTGYSLDWIGTIPAELAGLSSLRVLVLGGGPLKGAIPAELGGLANLERLSIVSGPLTGGIPPDLGRLTKLKELWLQSGLTGGIPAELGNLSALEKLDLAGNDLTGGIPAELGKLSSLKILNLGINRLTGTIPAELGKLSNLEDLILLRNQLAGEIPVELGKLSGLKALYLKENRLTGEVPSEIGDLSDLRELHLQSNLLNGAIPAEMTNLHGLLHLNLSDNRLTGVIPAALGNMTELRWLELGNNRLIGSIPPDLGGLSKLNTLNLSDNRLSGEIPVELGDLTNPYPGHILGSFVYLHGNELRGCIPTGLRGFGGMNQLLLPFCDDPIFKALRDGTLKWSVEPLPECRNGIAVPDPDYSNPGLLQDCSALLSIKEALAGDAALNWSLDTPMSDWDGIRKYGFLYGARVEVLFLTGLGLNGEIPAGLGNLSALRALHLTGNELTGEIPGELSNLSLLRELHLGGNRLTGEIPAELGNLSSLSWLYLDDNRLTGMIPAELGDLTDLGELHLEDNLLTGDIPIELTGLHGLWDLDLAANRLTGEIPAEFGNRFFLSSLSLADNDLTGEIPEMVNLTSLFLAGNDLHGCIPARLRDVSGDLGEVGLPFCRETEPSESDDTPLVKCFTRAAVEYPYANRGLVSDCAILLDVKDTLAGDAVLNWSADVSIREWDGVGVVGGNGRVAGLYFEGKGLTGEIPPELGSLSELESLELGGNDLSGCIPDSLRHVEGDLDNLGLPFCGDAKPTFYCGAPFAILANVTVPPRCGTLPIFFI